MGAYRSLDLLLVSFVWLATPQGIPLGSEKQKSRLVIIGSGIIKKDINTLRAVNIWCFDLDSAPFGWLLTRPATPPLEIDGHTRRQLAADCSHLEQNYGPDSDQARSARDNRASVFPGFYGS